MVYHQPDIKTIFPRSLLGAQNCDPLAFSSGVSSWFGVHGASAAAKHRRNGSTGEETEGKTLQVPWEKWENASFHPLQSWLDASEANCLVVWKISGLFSISYMGCHPSHWRTHIEIGIPSMDLSTESTFRMGISCKMSWEFQKPWDKLW